MMKPVHQTIFGGERGNCMQAALASVLELPLDAVPNFMEPQHRSHWDELLNEWLSQFDLYLLSLHYSDTWAPKGYHFIVGKSPRGEFHHVVMARDGVPIHDPYPDGNCKLRTREHYEVLVSRMEVATWELAQAIKDAFLSPYDDGKHYAVAASHPETTGE